MKIACDLSHHFSFVYRAEFDGGLVERELDHVFIGTFDDEPDPDPDEIAEYRWTTVDVLRREMIERAGDFTPWFRICFERAVTAPRITEGDQTIKFGVTKKEPLLPGS